MLGHGSQIRGSGGREHVAVVDKAARFAIPNTPYPVKNIVALSTLVLLLFSACKKEEESSPCDGVICLNGGYCANGACVCASGYTGADCSQQVTPTAIRVNSIKVTSFPATDGGAGWDLTSGPEILPVMRLGSTTIWTSPVYYPNADPSLDYTFTPNPTFNLTSLAEQYSLILYDWDDPDADDFMGGVNFTPSGMISGFPTTLVLAPSGGSVTFTLNVSYIW